MSRRRRHTLGAGLGALAFVLAAGSVSAGSPSDVRATLILGNIAENTCPVGTVAVPKASITYTLSPRDGNVNAEVDISAVTGYTLSHIYVKGGDDTNLYEPGKRGLPSAPPYVNLISPLTNGGNIPTISHWWACGSVSTTTTTTTTTQPPTTTTQPPTTTTQPPTTTTQPPTTTTQPPTTTTNASTTTTDGPTTTGATTPTTQPTTTVAPSSTAQLVPPQEPGTSVGSGAGAVATTTPAPETAVLPATGADSSTTQLLLAAALVAAGGAAAAISRRRTAD